MSNTLRLACLLLALTPALSKAQQLFEGAAANEVIEGTNTIWIKKEFSLPTFIRFEETQQPVAENITNWMQETLDLQSGTGFITLKEEVDQLGHHHIRFQQTFNDRPIAFAHYTAHVLNGKVYSLSGTLHKTVNAPQGQFIDERTALRAGMKHIGASSWKWQSEAEEAMLKQMLDDPKATYQPKGTLVLLPKGAKMRNAELRYAWKFDLYAHEPESRTEIYIDALDASIVFENQRIHEVDVPGKAVSAFSDTVDIVADSYMGVYRLSETGRGNGIHTWNMETRTNPNTAVEFTDDDNFWNNFNAQKDEYAIDAHWGAEMTYDYMLTRFNRNSIDNNGFRLNSFVHYDNAWSNASWNGFSMRYGDGTATSLPFTTLDISGHEIGHGLTDYTADLVYQDEYGALNESFSDILGACIEFFVKQNNGNWLIGEDRGSPLRNMANPNAFGDPDTYFGNFWVTGTVDNGGVHTNSGVQNYWFYLLSEGGSGTNDKDSNFTVQGIGIVDAANIAYRNLSVYLGRVSEYEDARFFSIQSAIDLFGSCTEEHEATVNAWFAVGLGDRFQSGVVSDFEVDLAASCQLPFLAHFTNNSKNGTSYLWRFGDGGSSTETSPSHLYTEKGIYSVTLAVDGEQCGASSTTKTDFIQLVPAEAPIPDEDTVTVCPGEIATLKANTEAGEVNWYAEENGDVVFTGNQYQVGPLNTTQQFFVENVIHFPEVHAGPADNTIGSGRYSNANEQLFFDVYQSIELISVLVYSNSEKARTVEIYNDQDSLVASKEVDIPRGEFRVPLGFKLQPGFDYRIGFKDNTSPLMYIIEEGVTFPYTTPGIIAITGNTANLDSRYFFFFDWEVKAEDCVSPKTAIHAAVGCPAPPSFDEQPPRIYPNPGAGQFFVESWFTDNDYIEVKLYNTNGQLVREYERRAMEYGLFALPLSLNDIAPGLYYISIETSRNTQTEKLIVKG